jgi:hypothetical protein
LIGAGGTEAAPGVFSRCEKAQPFREASGEAADFRALGDRRGKHKAKLDGPIEFVN